MYWRVRKVSPEQIAKTYGVHVVCIVSVLLNLILVSSNLAKANKLSTEQKVNFDTFVRDVTRHLVDTSYLTYENSMIQLAYKQKPELSPQVFKMLMQAGPQGEDPAIPPSLERLKGMKRQLESSKCVTAVSLDNVKIEEPDSKGMVPVLVEGRAVKHDAGGVFELPFRFRMLVGTYSDGIPVVAAFQDASGQAPSGDQ